MPQLIDRLGAAEETWTLLGADDPLPEGGAVILPPARLAEASGTGLELGVHIRNDIAAEDLQPWFGRLLLISVEFPSFADGRGFSIGQRLRSLGYRGRLRATGPVIADQFAYLLSCGYDEVSLPDEVARRQPPEQWAAARERITLGYQRGRGGRGAILDARRAARDR